MGGTTATLSTYEPGAHVPPHRHGSDQLCILLDGRYEARWAEQRARCLRGDAVLHPAGVLHEDRLLDERCASVRIEWSRDAELPWARLRRARRLESPRIAMLAGALGEELALGPGAGELVVDGLLTALCGAVARSVDDPPEEPPGWVLEARDVVRARFRERLGLREVAEAVGRGANRLAEQFRSHFGCSVGAMVRRLRIEYAEQLMRRGELALAEVAFEAGFCDQAHLGRVFREVRGVSPSAWRAGLRRREPAPDVRP